MGLDGGPPGVTQVLAKQSEPRLKERGFFYCQTNSAPKKGLLRAIVTISCGTIGNPFKFNR